MIVGVSVCPLFPVQLIHIILVRFTYTRLLNGATIPIVVLLGIIFEFRSDL